MIDDDVFTGCFGIYGGRAVLAWPANWKGLDLERQDGSKGGKMGLGSQNEGGDREREEAQGHKGLKEQGVWETERDWGEGARGKEKEERMAKN